MDLFTMCKKPACPLGGNLPGIVDVYLGKSPLTHCKHKGPYGTKLYRDAMLKQIITVEDVVLGKRLDISRICIPTCSVRISCPALGCPGMWKQLDNHHIRLPKDKRADMLALFKSKGYMSRKFTDFEDIFNTILNDATAAGIVTSACLWIYDIALRLGSTLKPQIFPDKYVYLYCGAYMGYKNLCKVAGIPFPHKHKVETATIKALFPSFVPLSSAEIEDLLCCYADCF